VVGSMRSGEVRGASDKPLAGGRTRRRRARRDRFGAPRVDSFDGEGHGDEAERMAWSVELGGGRSGGGE
jgi:hypothetical protein